jgi:type IV secretion system protein VirB9
MMKHCKFRSVMFLIASIIGSFLATAAVAETPITTDSRIKTFVYNENEVYPIVVHYGYQTSIEFGTGEEASTTSIGDSYSWKLTRVGNRLFIKTLESNAHTNLTIITNRRTYQFDLLSKMPDEHLDEELVYVVRFFYPDDNRRFDKVTPVAPAPAAPPMPMPMSAPMPMPYQGQGR